MKKQTVWILCLLLFLSACGKGTTKLPAVTGNPLSPAAATAVFVPETEAPQGYSAVARNEKYALFADMQTGDFAVWDFANGQFTYSGHRETLDPDNPISGLNFGEVKTELASLLSIQCVQVSTIASTDAAITQNSYVYSVKKNTVQTQTIQNGYRVTYTFSDTQAVIPVEITLHEGGVTARVAGEGISIGSDYRIVSIDLLPGFMAGYEKNDGYLFVPSGSGALVALGSGRGESASYREMVYGDDRAVALEEHKAETRQISVPVYGIKEGDRGIFAVITKGDASAEIEVAANSPRTCFTRVFSSYVTATTDSTTLFESNFENQRIIYGVDEREQYGDYEVEYHFLSGENASWVGMANLYRQKLALQKNPKAPELMLTVYGAAQRKATFLGIPYQQNFALTSFDEAREILVDLSQAGVSAGLRYIGWNNSGIQNKKVPTSVSPCGVLGGKRGFRKLTEELNKSNTAAYFDADFMIFRQSGRGYSVYSDVCRSIFGTRTPIYQFMRSTYVPVNNQNPAYLLTPDNALNAAETFLQSAKDISGLSLSDFGSTLYSDFSAKYGRESCMAAFCELLKKAAQSHALTFDTANAYAYPYADRICSLPVTSDGNLLFSSDVPFLQLLLHGAVSYSAEDGTDLLDCIAYGADPQMTVIAGDDSELMETSYNWLYGTTYKNRAQSAKEIFRQYSGVYQDLYAAAIVDYKQDGECSETVFDNGTAVLVNRGGSERTIDGVTVSPGGFAVVKEADKS